jgi:hypothetical protein
MKNNNEEPSWKKLVMSASILFTTLIFCFLFGMMISYFSSSSYATSNHTRWEYKISSINSKNMTNKYFNEIGKDGWEVAAMNQNMSKFLTEYIIIFKRSY